MNTDYRNVTFLNGFWHDKQKMNSTITTQAVYDRFAETGRMDAFKCEWKEGDPNKPHIFWDSDVAKWMEGAAYILAREERPDLVQKVEELIDRIEKNQGEDGYFNIYYTVVEPQNRFTVRNNHELYCAGHLMEAACAYYEATGKDRFLRLMEKYADYIAKVFMVEHSAKFETPGHEEIELALYRMYRTTGEKRFWDLCAHFLERRGQPDNEEAQIFNASHYAQSHAPIREQHEAFGHSVRAVYLYSGMADYAKETGDEALLAACRDLFEDMVTKKMYITGGLGSTRIGEAFTVAYDLPNAGAYTETCASIGMIFFARRMMAADPANAARYADIIELEMYNGALSGVSLDGDEFFYENPLEICRAERHRITGTVDGERWPPSKRVKVFGCSCCPPNLTRWIASLGQDFYALDEESGEVYIHQFADSAFEKDGVSVRVETKYPYSGRIHITANAPVYVRIPAWCRRFTADQPYTEEKKGYARFEAGEIQLTLRMRPELVASSVRVSRNIGKAALRRGPMIYCAEGIDHDGDVHTLCFDRMAVNTAKISNDDVLRTEVITMEGWRRVDTEPDALYAPLLECYQPVTLRMIPYHLFANREKCDMLVYLSYR